MQFNIIGGGKLGLNLATALQASGQLELAGLCNRSLASAKHSRELLGFGKACASLSELPAVAVTFITCSDDSIALVAEELAQLGNLTPNSFVIHCSGVLNSEALAPLRKLGCQVASFHPLKAFREGLLDEAAFQGVYCTVEGDATACQWVVSIFSNVGALIRTIPSEAKVIYHAASCMACNYLVTLAFACETLLLQADFPKDWVRAIILNQMEGGLTNLQQTGSSKQALTGPLLRGDTATIAKHLEALSDPLIKNLYQAAGQATLELTDLSEEKKQALRVLLNKETTCV